MKRVLCVWLPNWSQQRLRLARPERRTGFLACPNPGEHSQSGSVPDFQVVDDPLVPGPRPVPDLHADRAALTQLAAWCQQFSPSVGLEEGPEPESLLLDMTGAMEYLGGETALIEQVAQAFAARGLTVHLGLGETIGAAWARAHFTTGEQRSTANDPPSYLLPPTSSLLLSTLRLPPGILATLVELGVASLSDLLALPRASLAARFGADLLARIDQAVGRLCEVIEIHHPDAPPQAAWSFESPTDQAEIITAVLDRLLEQVMAELAVRRHDVVELECRFSPADGQPLLLHVGLFRPCGTARHVRELIQLQLERLRRIPPLNEIHVQIIVTRPLEYRQRELPFAGDGLQLHDVDEEQRQLAALIERLASRLGRNAVLRACLLAEVQPEYICRCESWLDARSDRRRSNRRGKLRAVARPIGSKAVSAGLESPAHGVTAAPPRPLRLCRQPILVEVLSIAPDGPPQVFRLGSREHAVQRYCGPERIETGWWRQNSARRDYYRVEDQHGEWFWLFRRLRDGRWFWQGTFE